MKFEFNSPAMASGFVPLSDYGWPNLLDRWHNVSGVV
jgi:hypothetical protein